MGVAPSVLSRWCKFGLATHDILLLCSEWSLLFFVKLPNDHPDGFVEVRFTCNDQQPLQKKENGWKKTLFLLCCLEDWFWQTRLFVRCLKYRRWPFPTMGTYSSVFLGIAGRLCLVTTFWFTYNILDCFHKGNSWSWVMIIDMKS